MASGPHRRRRRRAGRQPRSAGNGIFTQLNYDITGLARTKAGRRAEPSAAVIDTQSVKTSTNAPTATQGTDAGKRIIGRQRGIVTDTLGLLLAVVVTAASASDDAIGVQLLTQAKSTHHTPAKTWADAGFKFPAEHWVYLRTTNPIESTFATVRHRTKVTKGPGSKAAGLAMAFKLIEAAQRRWRAVNAPHPVALVRAGARFERGRLVERPATEPVTHSAAAA